MGVRTDDSSGRPLPGAGGSWVSAAADPLPAPPAPLAWTAGPGVGVACTGADGPLPLSHRSTTCSATRSASCS
ncbi:MAG: hypothetical protein ACK2UH_06250 [Candidatus Promineifilaceae bacterium]